MKGDGYTPTALERRHPAIVARKKREAENALRDQRYRECKCTECGYALDDFDLMAGFEKCGECEEAGR